MDSLDALFHALAHRTRRAILDIVKESPGCTVTELCAHFPISRIGVMKHLKILSEAGLITSVKEGRTRRLYFNVIPIQTIYDRWTTEYSALWASRLTQLKYAIESDLDSSPAPPSGGPTEEQHEEREDL